MQSSCHIPEKIKQKISGFIQGYISQEQVSITHVEALPRQCLHVIVYGKTRVESANRILPAKHLLPRSLTFSTIKGE
jgi:hypothetical protein